MKRTRTYPITNFAELGAAIDSRTNVEVFDLCNNGWTALLNSHSVIDLKEYLRNNRVRAVVELPSRTWWVAIGAGETRISYASTTYMDVVRYIKQRKIYEPKDDWELLALTENIELMNTTIKDDVKEILCAP